MAMTSNSLTLAKVPVAPPQHESASTNIQYWRDRYPMLLATMSAMTGKATKEVAEILVAFARVPFTSDGDATARFMREVVAS